MPVAAGELQRNLGVVPPASPDPDAPIDRDRIVAAALEVLRADGLDAVSMRRVASELGVSPIPVYNHVGNKEALLDAMTEQLFGGLVGEPAAGESWTDYARTWCSAIRDQRRSYPDARLLLRGRREPMSEIVAPLIRAMRHDGIVTADAVHAARLLLWSVLGHLAIELGRLETSPDHDVDTDRLFEDHVRHLLRGIEQDLA